jgi:hypothetical protein
MRKVFTLVASLGLLASPAMGQVRPDRQGRTVDSVTAQAALRTFTRLVNEDNYRDLGFDNPKEIRSATLGVSMPEYLIRLDELRSYQSGQDPAPLLHATGRVTLFVLVGGVTRSSIALSLQGQTWEPVGYGSPQYGRSLDSARTQLATREGRSAAEYFEVRVAALNVTFVGAYQGGQLFLTPVRPDQRFGFESGSTLPAGDALKAMVSAAQSHNGLPT